MKLKMFPITFIVSTIGLIFSLYNIYGTEPLFECGKNCSIFADFSFMGLSLWYFGAAYFLLVIVLSICRTFFLSRFLLIIITSTALLADTFLLWIMIKTTPCYYCMIEGVLIFLSYCICRHERRNLQYFLTDLNTSKGTKTFVMGAGNNGSSWLPMLMSVFINVVKYIWIIFFIMLIGAAINQNQSASSLINSPNPTVKIYFSPSCKACKELVGTEYMNKSIEWVPVEENAGDIWKIISIKEELAKGKNLYEALLKTEDAKLFPSAFDYLRHISTQIDIWINTAKVRNRTDVVPYIEVFGSPKFVDKSFIGSESKYCSNGSLCNE